MQSITLHVNGQPYTVEVHPDMPLLWVLRDLLGLTGTKYGCGIGQCGACTVHQDGEAIQSCTTPVSEVHELVERRNAGDAPLWDSIYRTPYWDVVHCNSTSLLGWLILVQRRHIAAIEELSEAEAIELGKLIRHVSIVLTELTGCIKTYVVQFAEAPGHHHVHFHIIPRMPNQLEEHRGPGIFKQRGVSEAERVSEADMNELAQKVRLYLERSGSLKIVDGVTLE